MSTVATTDFRVSGREARFRPSAVPQSVQHACAAIDAPTDDAASHDASVLLPESHAAD